jgi:GntR family transcriptional regulator, transcriptional repressor for pyruvate dehydrogenase complex
MLCDATKCAACEVGKNLGQSDLEISSCLHLLYKFTTFIDPAQTMAKPVARPKPATPIRIPVNADRLRGRLSDTVYERIMGDILSGLYPVQKKLPTETALAESYGVSRPVVRDALARLRADGIVASRQGSGTHVLRMPAPDFMAIAPAGSIADLMRSFEFRVALEGEAAALAAERRSDRDVKELRSALKELEQAIKQGKLGTDADMRFHNTIADATGNPFFKAALQTLSRYAAEGIEIARTLSLASSKSRVQLVQKEHKRVLEKIIEGDVNGARDAMRAHLQNAKIRVLTNFVEPRRP